MNSNFIEGFLQLRNDGHWYVNDYKLKEGTLFEILKDNKWIMFSMEKSQGVFYCYPLNPLNKDDLVRVEVSEIDTIKSTDISKMVNELFMKRLFPRKDDKKN